MDYSKMTDFEINKRVADIAMNGTWHVRPSHPDNTTGGWLYGSNCIQTYDLPDYCNNAADAWPIITASRISIMFDETDPQYDGEHHEWCDAISSCQKFCIQHQSNPLRAAMLVYLQLQGAK